MIMEWNIQGRANCCHACAAGFKDGEVYHTALVEKPPGFERHDWCKTCWADQGNAVVVDRHYLSHWQGVYLSPPPAPPDPIRKETAESLLRKLLERQDPRHEAACYIL